MQTEIYGWGNSPEPLNEIRKMAWDHQGVYFIDVGHIIKRNDNGIRSWGFHGNSIHNIPLRLLFTIAHSHMKNGNWKPLTWVGQSCYKYEFIFDDDVTDESIISMFECLWTDVQDKEGLIWR
jgi:hypothetical protein